jgi:hypothetical protein
MTINNKTSVFRVLCQSLNELKQFQISNTPQEKLARAQALLLYQIIGLFDGDITLRSDIDQNMHLLQDWIVDLCKIRENLGTKESMKDPNPPRSWEVSNLFLFSSSLTVIVVDIF